MRTGARLAALYLLAILQAACGSSIAGRGAGGDSGGAGGGGQGGGGQGGANGCSASKPCEQGFFCHWDDGQCGMGNPEGTCEPAPMSDCGPAPMACGCSGVVAQACGDAVGSPPVDVANAGMCPVPAGLFGCGTSYYCDPQTQYCTDTFEAGEDSCFYEYACVPLPSCVGSTSCDCIVAQYGLMEWAVTCSGDAASGLTANIDSGGDSPGCP